MSYFSSVKTIAVKSVAQVSDWTAVAQNTIVKSAILDTSLNVAHHLNIQAFLDTETAHGGTRFVVQVSSSTSGNEDWVDYTEFIGLIGTANTEAITNNPATGGTTILTVVSTVGYTTFGLWRAIEDSTLINSELIYQTAYSNNASITILDGITNQHAQTTPMYNLAFTQVVLLTPSVNRVRLVVDNTYSAAGSTLNFKLRASYASSL